MVWHHPVVTLGETFAYSPGNRSLGIILVWCSCLALVFDWVCGQCVSSGDRIVPCPWCLSGYGVMAYCQWFGLRSLHMVWTSTRLVHFMSLTTMYRAYHMWHSSLTLLQPSICGFALGSRTSPNGRFSRHSVLRFCKENQCLGSIWGEPVELQSRVCFINTTLNL